MFVSETYEWIFSDLVFIDFSLNQCANNFDTVDLSADLWAFYVVAAERLYLHHPNGTPPLGQHLDFEYPLLPNEQVQSGWRI